MSQTEVILELSAGPDAPSIARAALSRELDGKLSRQQLFDLRVVVSTLVSNSIRSEGGDVKVQLRRDRDHVRGEVSDTGAGAVSLRGRGVDHPPRVAILDALAEDWGTDEDRVWFVV